MAKFKVGDTVGCRGIYGTTRVAQVLPEYFGPNYSGYRLVGYNGEYEEQSLWMTKPQCPVCAKQIDLKDNKFVAHGPKDDLCYGSFTPA
jgi:hypothetical protein